MSYPSAFVEFFGPCTWKAMHSVAFSYARDPFSPTPQEHKAAVDFFGSMAELIPCHMCRKHYKDYIREHPIKADNRDELAKWVFDLHNDVNRRTNKPRRNIDDSTMSMHPARVNTDPPVSFESIGLTRWRKSSHTYNVLSWTVQVTNHAANQIEKTRRRRRK